MKKVYVRPEIESALRVVCAQLICDSEHDYDHADARGDFFEDENEETLKSRNLWDE